MLANATWKAYVKGNDDGHLHQPVHLKADSQANENCDQNVHSIQEPELLSITSEHGACGQHRRAVSS
jgi:hypothetical protein